MSRWRKSLAKLLNHELFQSFDFEELCGLLVRLGFEQRRVSGSHDLFARRGIPEIVNIQPRRDGTAKPYQLRQIRALILRYGVPLDPEDK